MGYDGIGDESNLPQLSLTVPYLDREQWGWGYWFVIRSESGKLVVTRRRSRKARAA